MNKFFKDCLTEDDGESFCLAKCMSLYAFLAYHAFTCYLIWTGHQPSLTDYANGTMQVLGGCGALIAGKQWSQK